MWGNRELGFRKFQNALFMGVIGFRNKMAGLRNRVSDKKMTSDHGV